MEILSGVWITPASRVGESLEWLARIGATGLVTCGGQTPFYTKLFRTSDAVNESHAFALITKCLANGENLVICGPTWADPGSCLVRYMMHEQRVCLKDALSILLAHEPRAMPSANELLALGAYEYDTFGEFSLSGDPAKLNELRALTECERCSMELTSSALRRRQSLCQEARAGVFRESSLACLSHLGALSSSATPADFVLLCDLVEFCLREAARARPQECMPGDLGERTSSTEHEDGTSRCGAGRFQKRVSCSIERGRPGLWAAFEEMRGLNRPSPGFAAHSPGTGIHSDSSAQALAGEEDHSSPAIANHEGLEIDPPSESVSTQAFAKPLGHDCSSSKGSEAGHTKKKEEATGNPTSEICRAGRHSKADLPRSFLPNGMSDFDGRNCAQSSSSPLLDLPGLWMDDFYRSAGLAVGSAIRQLGEGVEQNCVGVVVAAFSRFVTLSPESRLACHGGMSSVESTSAIAHCSWLLQGSARTAFEAEAMSALADALLARQQSRDFPNPTSLLERLQELLVAYETPPLAAAFDSFTRCLKAFAMPFAPDSDLSITATDCVSHACVSCIAVNERVIPRFCFAQNNNSIQCQTLSGKPAPRTCRLHVWSSYLLPPALRTLVSLAQSTYTSTHCSRRLAFAPCLGTVELVMRLPSCRINITLPTPAACILLFFESDNSTSYSKLSGHMVQGCGMPACTFQTAFQLLIHSTRHMRSLLLYDRETKLVCLRDLPKPPSSRRIIILPS
ncbi:hypothetical protein DIPPA_52042 [Diplonema papillatum]|nr:hypothetical protein DIPPA_52042 [Diplonema papillatum]